MSAASGAGAAGTAAQAGTDVRRPDTVPAELVAAWELLERGVVGAVVADVEGGATWPTVDEAQRHRELGRRLESAGHLHPSLTPESFAVLRERAAERAGSGAPLAAIWALVPEWCHPGATRHGVADLELDLIAGTTVPDPDVALFLEAAAAARLPISAISAGPLSADQLRRRLEHPALDAVTWRAVRAGTDDDGDAAGQALAAAGSAPRPILLLTARTTTIDHESLHVVRLGAGPRDATALERLVARVAISGEAGATPGAVRDAWVAGAAELGPVLVGFAEWSVRHAAGHAGAPIVVAADRGGLLPELVAEIVRALGLPVPVRVLPVTPALVAAAAGGGAAVGTALTLALGRDGRLAEVAEILGLPAGHDDVASLATALAADPALQERAAARAAELSAELDAGIAAPAEHPGVPLVLCHVGGPGRLQAQLARALAAAGTPRHVVGLHLAGDATAADAILGPAGGEVLGYLANLGTPADAHAAATSWRSRIEELAGAPDRSRTSLAGSASASADDLRGLRVEAARRGVLAFLRQHLRLLAVAGDPAALVFSGPGLALRLAASSTTPSVVPAARPADALDPPAWIARVIDPLERALTAARGELATRDAVVGSRAYRLVLRLRAVVRHLRA
ncbi:hypothetical protein [Patulibacter sp.]|uniref:hypothetical protein n=1 Tax=Patulibacter sp. TaxID=1912859 RepID=UPI002726746C|nr:hypothetical protein [Patulibacter sp.]MDO9408786.1 hypothetical protein [Patulibacter sp.]